MLTKLGLYADRAIEGGWLVAAVLAPLYFNVYSSRVFEPDKISTLRSLVLLMTVAWLVKLLEGGIRGWRDTPQATLSGAVRGAAEKALPGWLGVLRTPMLVPVLVYALTYLVSSIFTITPDAAIYGSYQRLQGTYSQYSYIMLGILVLANMRTRAQLERLITFMVLTSVPVALYGLLQAARLDPLPWAGDTSTRVASTMGNAIFVAAWLIMVVPFTLYRLLIGVSDARSPKDAAPEASVSERGRSRNTRRYIEQTVSDYSWAVVANGAGIILCQLLAFLLALKLMAGLPFPDARIWWALPLAIALFAAGCGALGWLSDRRHDPRQTSTFLPLIGVVLFVMSVLALPLSWSIDRANLQPLLDVDAVGFLWVLFVLLMWASIAAAAYAFAGGDRTDADGKPLPQRDPVRLAANAGYALLILAQIVCIYLTQSRGPWLGIGAGLVAFVVGMWLVGRRRNVVWMRRLGGAASAIVLAGALFVGILNIPDSPFKALSSVPVIGRGIERLSTLTETEGGTGKVRTLIWEGATNLILSDPIRTVIGWGPEAMYVAYNPFYPADLAHYELRNATPDRSHNVEFDQLVTLGVLGLIAYYFLVGAFFFYSIRIVKRATSLRDQILGITLLASMAAHFVEIQTGIQIASTWTYFYLLVGMLVALGYFMTNYLRKESSIPAYAPIAQADEVATNGSSQVAAVPATPALVAASRSTTEVAHVGRTATKPDGNGKSKVATAASTATKGKNKSTQATRATTATSARDSRTEQEPRRKYAPGGSQPVRTTRPVANSWVSNPVKLVLYGAALIAALLVVWNVNSATVRADTLYKQGLSYDSARRWPESIAYYQQAIDMQPNQDYYYLFLGRSWLEYAKQVDPPNEQEREQTNMRTGAPYTTQADRDTEEAYRLAQSEAVLQRARNLNPLNTDHYANLGRLYLSWADPSIGNDPSKSAPAVEWMKKATERTPGNAQLWNQLAVAYARNNQFKEAIDTLDYSQQKIDPIFSNTTLIRAQLLQERVFQVKDALQRGAPLPTNGETDIGKLVIDMGRAYSDTIGLDVAQFTDANVETRIDYLLDASKPFTATNTKLDPNTVSNAVTDTIAIALNNVAATAEKNLASYTRTSLDPALPGDLVPNETLTTYWADASKAGAKAGSAAKEWLDPTFATLAQSAYLPHLGLGYVYTKTGNPARAREELQRALLLNPNSTEAARALEIVK